MNEQKKSDASGKKTVNAVIGQPVQINLQSMVGSTGYGWYLTEIDGGLALSSAVAVPTAPGIAPVNHQFNFIAIAAGTFNLKFELLAPWRPEDVADTEVYSVIITPPKKTTKDDIEAGMAGREFLKTSSVSVGQQAADTSTVLKYAAPMVQSAMPQPLIYAAPMAQSAMPQSLIYAAPMAQAVQPQPIIYAAPMTRVPGNQYIDPCQSQQMYSMCQPYAAPWPNAQMQQLYAVPMSQSCQCPPMQALYAVPMIVRYAAPYSSGSCTC